MASKQSGKEIVGSSNDAGRKRTSGQNHDIKFKDAAQRDRYKTLVSKPLHPCRCPDHYSMNWLGIKDDVVRLLDRLGWTDMMKPTRGYKNFTYEFLSSIEFMKDKSRTSTPDHRVSFRLLNHDYEMSLKIFCTTMGFANAGFIHDHWNHDLRPADYDPRAFWDRITGLCQYNSRSNKASNIHNPVLRYLQRVMACTIYGRKELGTTRTDEPFLLWAMLYDHPVNTCYYLLDYLVSIGTRSDSKGEIIVGGIITFIVKQFGVGEEHGLNKIVGNNMLDTDTLVTMNFIKPHPPAYTTFKLKLNIPILFILPNPLRTNPEVEENLLYSVDQVHEDQGGHGSDGDDDEFAHDEPVQQMQMRGGNGCTMRFNA